MTSSGEGLRIILALFITACPIAGVLGSQTPDQGYGMEAEFDEALLKATIPSVMELGETYTVNFRVGNSGVLPGEYTVVLWCESSAIHPHIANRQFLLRPGQVERINFSLTAVMLADEPQTIRAMILARPSGKLPPTKIWETEAEVLRINSSERAVSLLIVAVMVTLLALLAVLIMHVVRRRRLNRAKDQMRWRSGIPGLSRPGVDR